MSAVVFAATAVGPHYNWSVGNVLRAGLPHGLRTESIPADIPIKPKSYFAGDDAA